MQRKACPRMNSGDTKVAGRATDSLGAAQCHQRGRNHGVSDWRETRTTVVRLITKEDGVICPGWTMFMCLPGCLTHGHLRVLPVVEEGDRHHRRDLWLRTRPCRRFSQAGGWRSTTSTWATSPAARAMSALFAGTRAGGHAEPAPTCVFEKEAVAWARRRLPPLPNLSERRPAIAPGQPHRAPPTRRRVAKRCRRAPTFCLARIVIWGSGGDDRGAGQRGRRRRHRHHIMLDNGHGMPCAEAIRVIDGSAAAEGWSLGQRLVSRWSAARLADTGVDYHLFRRDRFPCPPRPLAQSTSPPA